MKFRSIENKYIFYKFVLKEIKCAQNNNHSKNFGGALGTPSKNEIPWAFPTVMCVNELKLRYNKQYENPWNYRTSSYVTLNLLFFKLFIQVIYMHM